MRLLYSLLLYLLSPLVILYLAVRGFRDHRYWQRWPERFCLGTAGRQKGVVWIHAASLGEVNAASPMIEALAQNHPQTTLLITTLTPTGSDRVRALFGDRVLHQYVPLDLPGAVRRFLRRHQPTLGIVIETELWPNLMNVSRQQGVPLVIANGRLSDSSMRGYRLAPGLMARTLGCVDQILAQTPQDAERFRVLGAPGERIEVVGNLKFDISIPASLRETGELLRTAWGVQRSVLVAGSTHAQDEQELLSAFSTVLKQHPGALLILAPRHPERFGTVIEEAQSSGFTVGKRSQTAIPKSTTEVFVLDSMGELLDFYAAADVTFVGGTIEPLGGHNLLEPAALGKPLLFGPHLQNVQEVARQLLASDAARLCQHHQALALAVNELFSKPTARDRMGLAARKQVNSGRGALAGTLKALDPYL